MTDNIYEPPQSKIDMDTADVADDPLASRWSRLWASLLDSLIMMFIILPAMYFTGGFDVISTGEEPSLGYNLAIGVLGFIVFFILNTHLLINKGQTIGKSVLGIKIVDLDGNLPVFKNHILKRYAVYFLPGQVPIVGQMFSIVNILFIFGAQKRCIHDHAAGTKVVDAK